MKESEIRKRLKAVEEPRGESTDDHVVVHDQSAGNREGRQMRWPTGTTASERCLALLAVEPGLTTQALAARIGCSRSTACQARAVMGLRKPCRRKPNVTAKLDVDKGAPRCACGLLLPCACEGRKRSVTEFMGRLGEPRISSGGL